MNNITSIKPRIFQTMSHIPLTNSCLLQVVQISSDSSSFEDILAPFLELFYLFFSVLTNDLKVPTLSSLCF